MIDEGLNPKNYHSLNILEAYRDFYQLALETFKLNTYFFISYTEKATAFYRDVLGASVSEQLVRCAQCIILIIYIIAQCSELITLTVFYYYFNVIMLKIWKISLRL